MDLAREHDLRGKAIADLLECASYGVIYYGADGRMIYENPAACVLADHGMLVERVADVLALGVPGPPVERIVARTDGTKVRAWIWTTPMLDSSGKIAGALVGVIPSSNKPQQHLLELEAVIDSMVDGVFVIDRDLRFTFANIAGATARGLRLNDIVGHTMDEFSARLRVRHPDQRPYTRAELPLVRAMTGEVVRGLDKIVFNSVTGQDVHFRISASPVRDREGTIIGAVEVASDVTAVVELETLKDEFMQVVAHELKTPVTVVKGFIDLLLRDAPPDMRSDKRRKMLDAIDRGANRLAKIIDDVIDVSQLHLGRMAVRSELVELTGVVRKVVTTAQLDAPHHVFRMIGLDRPIRIRGDALRIEQIIKALVDNGTSYSPEGGDIEVAATIRDTQVVVTVTDHGVGIRAERQPRIFERFYRAHTDTPYDRGGLGVSLFIGRQLVRIMGGEMSFESQDGVGSRFSFTLPLWEDR